MAAHNYVRKYVRGPLWATLVAALVAAAGSLLVFGQSGEAAQGAKVRTYDPKIIGQTPVPDGKYPFMASLHRGDPGAASDNLNGSFFAVVPISSKDRTELLLEGTY